MSMEFMVAMSPTGEEIPGMSLLLEMTFTVRHYPRRWASPFLSQEARGRDRGRRLPIAKLHSRSPFPFPSQAFPFGRLALESGMD